MRWITAPGWPGHLLAAAAGALMTPSLAPFGWWPLALLSLGLIYLGLRELPTRAALWRGWWYGLGTFAAGTSWIYVSIHDYGAASPALAGLLMDEFGRVPKRNETRELAGYRFRVINADSRRIHLLRLTPLER